MPLMLNALLPGLGHLYARSFASGIFYLVMSLLLLTMVLFSIFEMFRRILAEEDWSRPMTALSILAVYGAAYTGLVMLDGRTLEVPTAPRSMRYPLIVAASFAVVLSLLIIMLKGA